MFNFEFGGDPFEGMRGNGNGHAHGRGRQKEVDNSKYYELLGVEKTASEAEIKKAFRKAALQHHPDRGGDPEKFKEISKAYEVLADKQKRSLYDEGGEEAVQDGGAGGGGGPSSIFEMFGFGGMGGRRGGSRVRRGEDVVFPLKVTLEDLYNGTSKKLRLTKNVLCAQCKGKGGRDGCEATCKECRGQGMRMVIRQIGPGMISQQSVTCSACKGSGSQIAEKDKCRTCMGEKVMKEKKTLEIHIARGMKHGEKIMFRGEADEAPDQTPGDVIVVLQQQDHPLYKRDGMNLFHKHTLTLLEALTGFSFPVQHLDGRTLMVKSEVNMVVKPGDVKKIADEGMPQKNNPYMRGALYIEFDVQFPESRALTESTKRVLRSVLPAPASHSSDAMSDQQTEEVTLVSVDFEREKQKFAEQQREEAYEEDEDEDMGRGRGQPQCRQQ